MKTCSEPRGQLGTIAQAGVLSLLLVENAWAYLDPATGWMILQGLIAAVAAAFVGIGSYWTRMKTWLTRGRHPGEAKDAAEGIGARKE